MIRLPSTIPVCVLFYKKSISNNFQEKTMKFRSYLFNLLSQHYKKWRLFKTLIPNCTKTNCVIENLLEYRFLENSNLRIGP